MRCLLYISFSVLCLYFGYYIFFIWLLNLYNIIGFSIYKQCIFNTNYHKFNGIIIGREPYGNTVEIKYIYENYEYLCNLNDIHYSNYITNTSIIIFAIPTTNICTTCSNNKYEQTISLFNILIIIIYN